MHKNADKLKALKAIFPGRDVEVSGVKVNVQPLAVAQLRKFSEAIATIIPRILPTLASVDTSDENAVGRALLLTIAPYAASDLLAIVDDCVDVELELIPHTFLPKIIDAWLEESFIGEGKLKPWMDLAKSLAMRLKSTAMGQAVMRLVEDSRTPSRSSVATASPSEISSTAGDIPPSSL